MKNKFIKSCENKFKIMKSKSIVLPCCSSSCESCCDKVSWGFKKQNAAIPKDVPRGHLVVYVGDDYKRFVIKMSLLTHPIFKALLDQAQVLITDQDYGFHVMRTLSLTLFVAVALLSIRETALACNVKKGGFKRHIHFDSSSPVLCF